MPRAKPTPGRLRSNESIDLAELLGSDWQGFDLLGSPDGQGRLLHSHWRKPFDAGELCRLFWCTQTVTRLENENVQLRTELLLAQKAANLAGQRAESYRRRLGAETRRLAVRIDPMFSNSRTGMRDPWNLPEQEKELRLKAVRARLARSLPAQAARNMKRQAEMPAGPRSNFRPRARPWDGKLHWSLAVLLFAFGVLGWLW